MKKNQKVIIVRTTAVDPDPRVMKTAFWLSEAGHNVRVIAWDREGTGSPIEMAKEVTVERCRFKGSHGAGIKNISGITSFNSYVLRRLFKLRPDIVHACDLDTLLPALIYKKIKGKKVVYDIFDFYSESRQVGRLKRIINKLERWALTKCDRIIIVHEKRIEQLEPIADSVRKKIAVIYNTPEEKPIKTDEIKFPYICYVGVLHPDRGIEYIIKVINQIPEIRFQYAGYGPLEEELALLSSNVGNVRFSGRVDYDTALQLEGGAMAIIAFYDPRAGGNNLYAAPNKLFEALMLGKPLITSEGTLLADIVKSADIGYVIPFGDENALRDTLIHIKDNPLEAGQKGQRARYLYETQYSAEIAKKRLWKIYSDLTT